MFLPAAANGTFWCCATGANELTACLQQLQHRNRQGGLCATSPTTAHRYQCCAEMTAQNQYSWSFTASTYCPTTAPTTSVLSGPAPRLQRLCLCCALRLLATGDGLREGRQLGWWGEGLAPTLCPLELPHSRGWHPFPQPAPAQVAPRLRCSVCTHVWPQHGATVAFGAIWPGLTPLPLPCRRRRPFPQPNA